jgi:hypothetical protein
LEAVEIAGFGIRQQYPPHRKDTFIESRFSHDNEIGTSAAMSRA